MFGIFIYDVLFFAVPVIWLILFGISLYRYISAKKQNKQMSGTFSPAEIKKRKVFLIVMSIVAGMILAMVIGLIAMLFMAVAFM